MIAMTLAEIATAVDGRLTDTADPKIMVTASVEHDSRKITANGLFVAINGEHVDGHDFAQQAMDAGAAAVLATSPVDVPAIMVDDALVALGKLARTVVDRSPQLTVVGITGSSGKTSTKDLIAQLCAAMGETVATIGNFNNELGHPYTVCRVQESTRYLVLEMGARGRGDLTRLCEIAPVDIGVVLNVGMAHLDGFGSIEATAKAKSELAAAVPPGGTAILNGDDQRVAAMSKVSQAAIKTFGVGADHDIYATDVSSHYGRPQFVLHTAQGQAAVQLQLHGGHYVSNALAAAAVAATLGMAPADIADSLGRATRQSERRMDVFTRGDITIIDDSYNANPASMAAALTSLADIGAGKRKLAVLGYMAEIQASEQQAHYDLGQQAAQADVDTVIAVEPAAFAIADGAAAAGVNTLRVDNQQEAIDALGELLLPGDTVLVKASRYRTWQVADYLRDSQVLIKEDHA